MINNCNIKEIILCSAKEIALEQGVTKINIREVAKRSGIAIGTVYNYYTKKDDLLVAVIEDFWAEALNKIDFKKSSDKSFYDKIQEIYDSMYEYFHNFKENWLEQLSLLNDQEKKLGRKKENEYFVKICSMIISLMDNDENIRNKVWDSSITKKKTAEFIFENMVIMFKKDESDPSFFIEILKKIMDN